MGQRLTIILFYLFWSGLVWSQGDDDIPSNEIPPAYADQWTVSAYVKLFAKSPTEGGPAEIELDDLSVFISGAISPWFNPFVEAEFFAVPLWQSGGNSSISDGHFIFERLYNDFNFSSDIRLRVGKFLAPVGLWNLIHAAPLVWSIDRPVSSTYNYANYISGIEYGHSLDPFSGKRLDLYLQLTKDWDPKPLSSHPRAYDRVFGGSLTLVDDLDQRASVDLQVAHVAASDEIRTTVSWQKVWYGQRWDLDSQLVYTDINPAAAATNKSHQWDGGGYVQVRYRFNPSLALYGRAERFHFAQTSSSGTTAIFGGRYRLGEWGNLNVEFRDSHGSALMAGNGFSLSYNALFRW